MVSASILPVFCIWLCLALESASILHMVSVAEEVVRHGLHLHVSRPPSHHVGIRYEYARNTVAPRWEYVGIRYECVGIR